jgi:hypothetical protein
MFPRSARLAWGWRVVRYAPPVAGWGDDPELERLRALIDDGWQVSEVIEDPDAPGGPADTVRLTKGGETAECTSDHLAFHRYVEGLRAGDP